MVQIAGKPYTQLLNLNILDELRVEGQPILGQIIAEISANYNVTLLDDVVIAIGGPAKNITLPLASTTNRVVSIKNRVSGIATTLPIGGNLIDGLSSVPLGLNESITLAPFSGGWARL